MKMPKEMYDSLKADIEVIVRELTLFDRLDMKTMWDIHAIVSRNRAYDDNHPNFKSKAWKRFLPFDGRNYCWYYDAGLDDSHVETALKKIRKELNKGG